MSEQLTLNLGMKCHCERCGRECQVAPGRTEEARLLRKAKEPKGYCVNCGVTLWLVNAYPINEIIEESPHGPEMLLHPHIQQQFGAIMRTGNADASLEEIDWEIVVANWHLPIEAKLSAENCHLPGDSLKRWLEKRAWEDGRGDLIN